MHAMRNIGAMAPLAIARQCVTVASNFLRSLASGAGFASIAAATLASRSSELATFAVSYSHA